MKGPLVGMTVLWSAIAALVPVASGAQGMPHSTTARLEGSLTPAGAMAASEVTPPRQAAPVNLLAQCQAIVVRVPQAVELKLSQIQVTPMPLTLYLSHPVTDRDGNVLVPAGTPVAAQVRASANGVQITTEAIVLSSQLLPFESASATIPLRQIQEPLNPQSPTLSLGTVGSGFGFLIGGEEGRMSGQAAGQVTGLLVQMLSDRTTELVSIAPQTEWVLYRR